MTTLASSVSETLSLMMTLESSLQSSQVYNTGHKLWPKSALHIINICSMKLSLAIAAAGEPACFVLFKKLFLFDETS